MSNIFTDVIGSIDYVTPLLRSLFVKPKLIEILKVSDKIQPVGNATAKITFSLSSKVSRKYFGTVMLVARASFALLIGRLNSEEKNRNNICRPFLYIKNNNESSENHANFEDMKILL